MKNNNGKEICLWCHEERKEEEMKNSLIFFDKSHYPPHIMIEEIERLAYAGDRMCYCCFENLMLKAIEIAREEREEKEKCLLKLSNK